MDPDTAPTATPTAPPMRSPWAPPVAPGGAGSPTPGGHPRRRRRVLVGALAVAGLGAAAFVAVNQLQSDDVEATSEATADGEDTIDGSGAGTVDELLGPIDDLGTCLADELGLEVPTGPGDLDLDSLSGLTPDELTAAWEACSSELEGEGGWLDDLGQLGDLGDLGDLGELGDLGDLDAVVDGVVECVGPIVEDLAPEHAGATAADTGTVTVAGPDGVTVYELGDGDGSVTVTRSDGELTVETDGDVDELDLGAIVDEGIAALEDCDLSLPFDLPLPDGGSSGD